VLRFPTIAAFVLGGLVGTTVGVGFAAKNFAHSGEISEFKVIQKNLNSDHQLPPALREYLKARLYYVAMSLDPKETQGQKVDFGPVDSAALGKADPRTEPVDYNQLYRDAVTRHTGAAPENAKP
jgi:hypothetical protein